jgi:hypothetical protein
MQPYSNYMFSMNQPKILKLLTRKEFVNASMSKILTEVPIQPVPKTLWRVVGKFQDTLVVTYNRYYFPILHPDTDINTASYREYKRGLTDFISYNFRGLPLQTGWSLPYRLSGNGYTPIYRVYSNYYYIP